MPSLTDFLRKQKDAAQSPDIAKKNEEWINTVSSLLTQIRIWLADAEQQNLIKVDSDEISITEESTGTYTAPGLTVTVPSTRKTVKVVPIGRTIIGANGRVDLRTSQGSHMLLYLADQGVWVHGTGPHPAYFPVLNEDLFTHLLTRALE